MNFEEIEKQLGEYKKQQKKVFSTSSMQTQSVVLLHIISRIDKSIPIYFINTGYHFPETIAYKNQVSKEFGLKIIDIVPFISKCNQKDSSGSLLFTSDPDYCCYLNKIQPMGPILIEYDVWINGIRAGQNENRKKMKVEEKSTHNTLRFHPMLDWSEKMIYDYIRKYQLPKHPLEEKGYVSIGCEPCTRVAFGDDDRDARWFGMNKTECGLNTELVINKNKE
jgi:phosphoadenosine phosphosulfate reductase